MINALTTVHGLSTRPHLLISVHRLSTLKTRAPLDRHGYTATEVTTTTKRKTMKTTAQTALRTWPSLSQRQKAQPFPARGAAHGHGSMICKTKRETSA